MAVLVVLVWTAFGGLMGWMVAFDDKHFYEQIIANPGKATFAFVLGAIVTWMGTVFFGILTGDLDDEEEETKEKKRKE